MSYVTSKIITFEFMAFGPPVGDVISKDAMYDLMKSVLDIGKFKVKFTTLLNIDISIEYDPTGDQLIKIDPVIGTDVMTILNQLFEKC